MLPKTSKYALRVPLLLLALSMSVIIALSACDRYETVTTGVTAIMNDFFLDPDVNLKDKNYAAADYLLQLTANHLNKSHLILARRMSEQQSEGISSPLGALIAEDIGMRLTQLGYNVDLQEVAIEKAAGADHNFTAAALPDFYVGGTYEHRRHMILIHLRLTDAQTGRIVSFFDYPLALSDEVRKLAKPEAKIYRLE